MGCGHSLGLLIMAGIFFAAGQTIDLDDVGGYLNYVVGVFMIALGVWTGRSIYRKYHQAHDEEKAVHPSCDDLESNCDSNRSYVNSSAAKLPTVVEFNPEPRRVATAGTSSTSGRIGSSPSSSFFLVVNNKADTESTDGNNPGTPVMALSPKSNDGLEGPKTFKQNYCANLSFENPMMQRVRPRLLVQSWECTSILTCRFVFEN